MARNRHPDVVFEVLDASGNNDDESFDTFDAATTAAVVRSLTTGADQYIDVVIWSSRGARWYGGDDAVDDYKDDPDASVFERIVVKANSQGRVP